MSTMSEQLCDMNVSVAAVVKWNSVFVNNGKIWLKEMPCALWKRIILLVAKQI